RILGVGGDSVSTAVTVLVNHGTLVESLWEKESRLSATTSRPVVEGCVPSALENSEHAHVSPSLRGVSPSPPRYRPQESHGAWTAPFAGSKFRLSPEICDWISHFTANPDS